MLRILVCVVVAATVGVPDAAAADDSKAELPTTAERTRDLERRDGFFPFYVDEDEGTVLAEIPADSGPFIYAGGLSSGLGSNPVGLDRGQWGKTRLCFFRRVGRRVYLIEQNTGFRAGGDAAERRAVRESFADSIFWATDIVAESAGTILIDLKTLLVRDAHQVVRSLKQSNQGDYRFDAGLSFVETDRCRAFPRNTELTAMVTYTSDQAGALVRQTAADGNSFSLRLHHSFVRLPNAGYKPRRSDPRVASFGISYADYSAPLDDPLEQRFIARHRLEKLHPEAARSRPVKPIVYYLDPGTPEPVRSALLEGARWWNRAFEEAGYIDAFIVRMLPEDADPMDVRFNVIQWVHRRTRGWSYGQSIIDPRTGEIIKGHVLLGSLRVRQDRLIIDGLTSSVSKSGIGAHACGIAGGGTGIEQALALFDEFLTPVDVSLARLRQLSAHEVGHTLGFSHNFAASTYADRASVMDYPAPRVRVTDDGAFDLSDAYGVGVGEWDQWMVKYAYTDFGDQAEAEGLQALLDEADRRGMRFLSDADARPAGAAHPLANLWDNGTDPIAELRHLMKVRRIALDRLGEDDVFAGRPLADLETVLVPIYLYHRYQVDAVAKMVGGFTYDYAVAGESHQPVSAVPEDQQKAAMDALIAVLQPSELEIPSRLVEQLPPMPHASAIDRERFEGHTAMIFDPDAAARSAASLVLTQVLQPERAARLATYGSQSWNLTAALRRLVQGLNQQRDQNPRLARIVEQTLTTELIRLADDSATSAEVRAVVSSELGGLMSESMKRMATGERGHYAALVRQIRRFLDRPHSPAKLVGQESLPPGSPIGTRK